MQNDWFKFRIRYATVMIFWFIILAIFLCIYFFDSSLFQQMQQTSYQNTPFVNTPSAS